MGSFIQASRTFLSRGDTPCWGLRSFLFCCLHISNIPLSRRYPKLGSSQYKHSLGGRYLHCGVFVLSVLNIPLLRRYPLLGSSFYFRVVLPWILFFLLVVRMYYRRCSELVELFEFRRFCQRKEAVYILHLIQCIYT